MDFYDKPSLQAYLVHHGIPGQKWGVRRFQNKDGSLTTAGKKRYSADSDKDQQEAEAKKAATRRKVIIGASVVTACLAAYGAYRYGKFVRDKNVELAVEKGKEMAKAMKRTDVLSAQKYPDVFSVKPDSYYEQRYVKEYTVKARAQSFSEARKNVMDKIRSEQARQKADEKTVQRAIKRLQSPKDPFDVLGGTNTITLLQQTNPELLKRFGVSIKDGAIYLNGAKL